MFVFLVVWCLVLPNRWALVASTDCFYGSVSTCSRSAVWRRETREKSGGMSLLDNMRREIKISIWLFFIFLFLSLSPSSVLSYFSDAMLFFSLLLLFDVFFLFIPYASFFILSIVVLLLLFFYCNMLLESVVSYSFFSFNLLLMLNVLCFRLLFWLCFCDVFF